jgi:hypothetical protein
MEDPCVNRSFVLGPDAKFMTHMNSTEQYKQSSGRFLETPGAKVLFFFWFNIFLLQEKG